MNKSETIKELATALVKFQAEVKAAPFNAKNPFLQNKYADLGSIIETARPVLEKHGLSVSQMVEGDGASIGVTTILMHSSGEWLESTVSLPVGDEKGKSQAQVAGSIVSYMRRYALSAALGMYTDEDTDGNKTQQAERKTTEKPPAHNKPANGNGTTPPPIDQPKVKIPKNVSPAVRALMEEGISPTVADAAGVLNKLNLGGAPIDMVKQLGGTYRQWRLSGKDPDKAAELTLSGEAPTA